MRRMLFLLSATLLLVAPGLTASPGDNAESHHEITIAAIEEGCPDGRTWCYMLVAGDLDGLQGGQTLTVIVENRGQIAHEVMVEARAHGMGHEEGDMGHDDEGSMHGNDTMVDDHGGHGANYTVAPGGTKRYTFTLPDDLEEAYFWCGLAGHEEAGMHFSVQSNGAVQGLVAASTEPTADAPVGLAPLLFALVAAVVVARSRA